MKRSLLIALFAIVSMTVVKAQCPFTPTITSNGPSPTCILSVYKFKTEAGNSNYQWSGSGISFPYGQSSDTVSVVFGTLSATLSVKYTKNGCTPSTPTSQTFTLSMPPDASVTMSPMLPAYCSGNTITYTAPTGVNISHYKWAFASGVNFATPALTGGSLTSNQIQVQWTTTLPTLPGMVYLEYDDSNLGCRARKTITNVINLPFTTTITTTTPLACFGSNVIFTAPDGANNPSSPQNINFTWTVMGSMGAETFQTGNSNQLSYPATTSGAKTVSVSYTRIGGGGGCTIQFVPALNFTVRPEPTMSVTAPSNPVCVGTLLDYVASPGFSSYAWIPLTPDVVIDPTYGANSQTIRLRWTNNTPTIKQLRLIATDANGCNVMKIIDVTTKGPGIALAQGSNLCPGGTSTINIDATIAGTPTWSAIGGTVVSSTSNSAIINWSASSGNNTIIFAGNGTSPDGCTISSATPIKSTVYVAPLPLVGGYMPSFSDNSLCTTDQITLVPSAPPTGPSFDPLSYSWTLTAPDYFISTGNQQATSSIAGIQLKWGTTSGTRQVVVRITDSRGCVSQPATLSFNVVTKPVISLAGTANAICSGQTSTLTVTGGQGPYTWMYTETPTLVQGTTTNLNTTYAADRNAAYTVSSTIPNACKVTSAPFNLSVTQVPKIVSETSGVSWFCDGSYLLLKVQTPVVGMTYQWKRGTTVLPDTGSSINANVAGDYTVTPVASLSCPSSPFTLTKVGPFTGVLTPDKPQTCGSGTTVNLMLSGSLPGYTFAIEKFTGTTWVTDVANYTGSAAVSAGTYRVKASISTCVFYSTSVVIGEGTTVNPTISPNGTIGICEGSTVTISSSTSTFQSYQWKVDDTPISPGGTNSTYGATALGTYSLSTIDLNGCAGQTSANLTLDKTYSLPGVGLSPGGPTTFCIGGSVQLNATTGLTSYKFYNGTTEVYSGPLSTYSATEAGIYTVRGFNTNGCSNVSSVVTVMVNSLPVVTVNPPGPVVVCGGIVPLVVGPGSSVLTAWEWKRGTTIISTTSTAIADQTASYTLKGTDLNGCVNTSAPVSVTINTIPSLTISPAGPLAICVGASATLTVTGGSAPYRWTKNSTPMVETTASITVTDAATYTAGWTNSTGCTGTKSVVVTLKPLPAATVSIVNNTPLTFCAGGSVALKADDGDQWQWKKDGSDIVGATSQQFTTTQSGVYTCYVQKSGCGILSNSTTVNVLPLPIATITPLTVTTMCAPGAVTLRAGTGVLYQWKLNGVPYDPPTTNPDKAFFVDGSFTVDVTGANGCIATSAPTPVLFYPIPATPSINVSGPTTFCDGASTTTLSSSVTASAYQWIRNAGNAGNASTYAVSNIGQTGHYTLAIADSHGCYSAGSAPVNIAVNALPDITINPSTNIAICSGSSATLSASPSTGMSYQWYRSPSIALGTAQTQSINMAGAYTVKATNTITGCVKTSAATTATLVSLPSTPTITQSVSCSGGSVTLTGNVTGSGYQWNTGATTASIAVTTTGTYTLKVLGSNGCWSALGSTTVSSLSGPNFTLQTTGSLCGGSGQVTISIANVVGTITSRQWIPAAGSASSIVVYSPGTYSCKVTFSGGCQITRTVVVPAPPPGCQINLKASDEPVVSDNLDVITESSFYPNPADREINLTTPTSLIARKVALINMQGVEVQTSIIPAGTSKTTLPLGSLADGMYIIQIQSNNKFERLKVIINQKR